MSTNLPTIIGPEGPQTQSPDTIKALIIARATELAPGLTTNLPGAMIEDIASTGTGSAIVSDQAKVDAINSLTPLGANDFTVAQLGSVYGVPKGVAANTSVFIQFTGTPGFVIAKGFTISDGSFQYVVQDGGIISAPVSGDLGQSLLIFAVSPTAGSWAVPPNTVTQFVTGVPEGISLTVTNPQAGIPSSAAETYESYRARVVEAGQAIAQGMASFLKVQLKKVPGVIARLVAVRMRPGVGYEIICGGGDPYQVAYAIFSALFDLTTLVGSAISITGITNASPGVVTTDLNHGLVTGQSNVHIAGVVGMTGVNGGPYTVTVLTEKTFSFGIDTTSSGAWTSGGVVTPNPRNITVDVIDPPDTYAITYVSPPQQVVTMVVTWNTNAPNVVDPAAVAQESQPALVDYINQLPVGSPINLYELQTVFQGAVSDLIDPQNLTRMVFVVNINGITVAPSAGTGIIAGDPESYFLSALSGIVVNQG